jgi:hypothetical protein
MKPRLATALALVALLADMKRLVMLLVLVAFSIPAYPQSTETRWWIFYQGFHMVRYPGAPFDTAMVDDTVPMRQRFGPFKTKSECDSRAAAENVIYSPANNSHGFCYQAQCRELYLDAPEVPERRPLIFSGVSALQDCHQAEAKLQANPVIDENYEVACSSCVGNDGPIDIPDSRPRPPMVWTCVLDFHIRPHIRSKAPALKAKEAAVQQ